MNIVESSRQEGNRAETGHWVEALWMFEKLNGIQYELRAIPGGARIRGQANPS